MKASEFIPEYNIDPDELHRAAYLQRAVDKYNSKYQNRRPAMPNPINGGVDGADTPADDSTKGFGKNFKSAFKNKVGLNRNLTNPMAPDNVADTAIYYGDKADDWLTSLGDPNKRSVDAIK